VTSEARKHSFTPVGIDVRDWRPGAPAHSRSFVTVGLAVIVSVVLVGLSVVAAAFVVPTVSAALFSGSQGQIRSGSAAAGQQSLELQSGLVERRRAAVVTYAAQFAEFKRATSRPPGAVGINLDAAEAKRRGDVLTGSCSTALMRLMGTTSLRRHARPHSCGLPACPSTSCGQWIARQGDRGTDASRA